MIHPTPLAQPIPSEIVRRAQSGDAEAFGTIYAHYAPGIYRYIYYRIGDSEQARDLQSDVFLRALEGIARYEERGYPIGSWLYRIARDRTIDTLRRRERGTLAPLDEDAEACDGPDGELDAQVDRLALQRALEQLCASHRQVLRLRFIYELPIQEVANQMGRTVGAIKSLQHRALENLAALMRAELGDDA